jgi:hypothetical protein
MAAAPVVTVRAVAAGEAVAPAAVVAVVVAAAGEAVVARAVAVAQALVARSDQRP